MIPKIIHYCWIGGKPLPPLAKKCIASWQKLMPDYEIKRWDETNYNFQKNAFMAYAYKQKKWGFVPDYARLDIVYNQGGIYLDVDVEAVKRFDELLTKPAFCGFESEKMVAFGLGFGAEKGNSVIKTLMRYYETWVWEQQGLDSATMSQNALIPSPIIQTQSLIENCGLQPDNTTQKLDGIFVYPKDYFNPIDHDTGRLIVTPNTYSIHHYMASWCTPASRQRGKIYQFLARYFGKKTAETVKKIWRKIK